eukprot:s32_g22.t2
MWKRIVQKEQEYWLAAFDVPDNIAKVRALRENIYAALVCSMTRTPIFILGKPGCSKSLTVSLLINALTDPWSDQLAHLASFSVQPYQGSRQSTSSSIVQVFERAHALQEKLRSFKRKTRPLALVLLDEVGLAEQSPHNPLKVLHARLEPRRLQDAVAVIAISNWELDRSKLSRGLLLACPPPSETDLQGTALAIIRKYLQHETEIRHQLEMSLGPMALAFMQVLHDQTPQDFHGLRDWYGMCSFAARLLLAADVEMGWSSEEAKRGALMRAVSDALSKEALKLVQFCRERQLQFLPADWALEMAVLNNLGGNDQSDTRRKMLSSLSEGKASHVIPMLHEIDPEVCSAANCLDSLLGDVDGRHIMVITDSPGPVMAWIQHRARSVASSNPESLVGSPLEQDQVSTDMYARSMIQAVKVSMAQERRLLILQNLDIIYAALYDVFNSNYSRPSGHSQRCCRVAMEGFCNNRCPVADQFKAVLVVTPERSAQYEPALLSRFAKLEVDLSDLVPRMETVLEWEEQVAQICPAVSGRNGEKATDIVAACPMDPDQLGLSLLLQTLTLSASLRAEIQESNNSSASSSQLFQANMMTKDQVLWPLLSPEFVTGDHAHTPLWCGSPKLHFGELLEEIYSSQRDTADVAGHVVIPMLIPTFCAPNHTLGVDAVPGVQNDLKVFSEIDMSKAVGQVFLRDSMKKHLDKIVDRISSSRIDGQVLSVLHLHVQMKHEHAQDTVDYLRFQLEWFAKELASKLKDFPAAAVHVLALVVHGVRGCEQDRSMRPFLFAGPCLGDWCREREIVKIFPWTGVAVDHFSHLLPWGMRAEELSSGTFKEIFGLDEAPSDRFRLILAEALPHIVPRFGYDYPNADSFIILQTLLQQIHHKPELVSCVRTVLTEHLIIEQADWRAEVARDLQLLRRAGPYQLALLSHLRRDDAILPVMKALWLYGLHSSCPFETHGGRNDLQDVYWRPVAESLLKRALGSASGQLQCDLMWSPKYASGVQSLQMPGSAVLMQIMFQMQHVPDRVSAGLQDRDFAKVLLEQVAGLAELLHGCVPSSLWQCLLAASDALCGGETGLGLLGEDVITEIAARACASMQSWPDRAVFHSVRSHLHTLVSILMRHVFGNHGEVDAYPKALFPAVAAALLLQMSQSVVSLQVKFSPQGLSDWDFTKIKRKLESAQLESAPVTWRTIGECGVKVVLEMRATELEESLCAGENTQDLRDTLQLVSQLSVAIEDFAISEDGRDPDIEVDPSLPLMGTSYALQLLNQEWKKDPRALRGCLVLLSQVIDGSGDFLSVHHVKTYLQHISLYLMEHLFSKVVLSSFRDWKEAHGTSEQVLNSFFALMEDEEPGLEGNLLETSAEVMNLLDAFLPSRTDGLGWDVPLLACLADGLSLTAQLGLIIPALVAQSVNFDDVPRSSKKALQMLEEAFRRCLQILRQRDSKASQFFVALVLARELVVQCVTLVEKAAGDNEAETRFAAIMDHIVDLLQLPLVDQPHRPGHVELCTWEGRRLHVEQFPTAFASLYMVSATRRSTAPLPTNLAVAQLFSALAMKAPGSDLHHLLQHCKAEGVAFSNILGLSMILPDQSGPENEKIIACLSDMGSADDSLSAQASERFAGLWHATHDNFQGLLRCMRAVGEVVCMQSSAQHKDTADRAFKISQNLPDSLGPAARLLALVLGPLGEENPDDPVSDLLSMEGEKAWRSSIMMHLLCFLGATHRSINREDIPPAVRPFAAFNDLNQAVLNSTFWPGLPDDWWQGLRYSGLHKHKHPINGNIVWAQCRCGYRYCFAQCGAPVSSAPCVSPEGEGHCMLRNGGQDHQFAQHQRLLAVVVRRAPHGDGWPPIWPTMKESFPEAFLPPAPSPGLFALTEADLQTSVEPQGCAAVSHSLPSETVRQDWNQPLGKPPTQDSGLHKVTFRVLHLLVHASALLSIQMEFAQGRKHIVHLLQAHLREVARMNCVRTANDTVWYLMANVEADLSALTKLLNGTVETVVQGVLGEKDAAGSYTLPGVHGLRRQAGQATDPNAVLTTDFLVRRGLSTDAWLCMEENVRSSLLQHILRPLVFATAGETLEELIVASDGGTHFGILRILMAGLNDDGSWQIQEDLLRAASLAWILPFMRLIREKEGGKMTMKDARRTTIQQWIENQAEHERNETWIVFRNCEAAWNRALAAHRERVGCQVVPLPQLSPGAPVAMLCPMVEPEKLSYGDLRVQDHPDEPEHIAAVALHALAVSHNKLIAHVQMYLNSAGAHVKARLHSSAHFADFEGQCLAGEKDETIRLIQHASVQDLFLLSSQVQNTCGLANHQEMYGPRRFTLDYKIESLLKAFFHIPWGADLPARGDHDLKALENDLAWKLVAGRRPLQVSSQDPNDLGHDIEDFPYRIFHGNIDVRILTRLKDNELAQQVSLHEAVRSNLEVSFYRDASHALEVSKITGDLIALLQGVNGVNVTHPFRREMTLREFVEVFTLVDRTAGPGFLRCESHPDALMRIANMPDIATVPLQGLVSLHLLAKDLLSMTQGVSVKTVDEGKEYTASWDLPPDLRNHMEDLKTRCPQALIVICRLVARSVYLASDLPMTVLEEGKPEEPPCLATMVKAMDILDELKAACEGKGEEATRLLDEPVPSCLKYWNAWNQGHVMSAVKEVRSYWSEVRGVYLSPPKPVAAMDPAIAGGMAKGFATGMAGRAARSRKDKKISVKGLPEAIDVEAIHGSPLVEAATAGASTSGASHSWDEPQR